MCIYMPTNLCKRKQIYLPFLYIYIYIHTHTHTHIYIYIM